MDISYDYYRVFYYVAKCGNMTQAAKMLVNNQPNLTRVIKTLEGELGCPLFIRSNRGMQLTPEGERLFAHVRIAVENMEAGEAEIAESRNLAAGSVYVAVSEVALHCVLLPVLEEYRRRYPGIRQLSTCAPADFQSFHTAGNRDHSGWDCGYGDRDDTDGAVGDDGGNDRADIPGSGGMQYLFSGSPAGTRRLCGTFTVSVDFSR